MRRGDYRNYYKGHMDKTNGGVEAREGGGLDWGVASDGREMQTTVIEQQ